MKRDLDICEINRKIEVSAEYWDRPDVRFHEDLLSHLFRKKDPSAPFIGSQYDEYAKIYFLNRFYRTHLSNEDILRLSQLLGNLKYLEFGSEKFPERLEDLIADGSPNAVMYITMMLKELGLKADGLKEDYKPKYCYVLATKYCSFAAKAGAQEEMQYPIFDSNVAKAYTEALIKCGDQIPENVFTSWDEKDCRRWNGHAEEKYEAYRETVLDLKNHYFLPIYEKTEYFKEHQVPMTIKTLDMYLWHAYMKA